MQNNNDAITELNNTKDKYPWKTPTMPNTIKTSDKFSYNFEWDGERYIAVEKEKLDGRQQ